MSAFVAASFDYVSPAGGLHARTESVDLTSLSFLGLISAFHLFCCFYNSTFYFYNIFLCQDIPSYKSNLLLYIIFPF